MTTSFKATISLAPGFSPVLNRRERDSRFNGIPAILKAGTSDFENTP